MAKTNPIIQTFAGGEIGEGMDARVDIASYQASAAYMDNWIPRAQGPMTRRPPLEHIDGFTDDTAIGRFFDFLISRDDNYLLLATDELFEFYAADSKLTIPSVSAQIANGTFSIGGSWTDESISPATASITNNTLVMTSDGANEAAGEQSISITETSTVHILKFTVLNGPINVRIGSSSGANDVLFWTRLRTGTHQLEFTPGSGTVYLQFYHTDAAERVIDNVSIMSSGDYTVETPYVEADLFELYTAQFGDRLWIFHENYAPRVLERRGNLSWSLIYFEPDDGPFNALDASGILISSNDVDGKVTLTSSEGLFSSDDERNIIALTAEGQYQKKVAAGANVYTDAIRVTGVDESRTFGVKISGTFSANVWLERSVGNENDFEFVQEYTSTENSIQNDSVQSPSGTGVPSGYTTSGNDIYDSDKKLNNQTVFYRLGVAPGQYTSGTITMEIATGGGSQTGIVRITNFVSNTSVNGEVLKILGNTDQTDIWKIGEWSDDQGWPNVATIGFGRLWVARNLNLWASKSDDFFSFEEGTNADEAIDYPVASRTRDGVRWIEFLDFVTVGTAKEETVVVAPAPADPLGPDNIQLLEQTQEGAARVQPVTGGASVLYIHRNGKRVMQYTHNPRALSEESFTSIDLNRLHPDICEAGIKSMAIQQEPERRIYVVLNDGTCRTCLFRREEDIVAWSRLSTDGTFEDVLVLSEEDEDRVYFIVRRTVNGTQRRFIEKMGTEEVKTEDDYVFLDGYLGTAIDRPDAILTPSALSGSSVTLSASESVFASGDVDKVVWLDGGAVKITSFSSGTSVTGTALLPLRGRNGSPIAIGPGFWGMAEEVSAVSGMDHFANSEVHIWADKAYQGTVTVSAGGEVTLPVTASRVFIGRAYTSDWRSLKLAYGANKGSAVTQRKNIHQLGFLLEDTGDGLQFGRTFENMDALTTQVSSPIIGFGPPLFTGEKVVTFNGANLTDLRLCIRADVNTGPATVQAIVPHMSINERV